VKFPFICSNTSVAPACGVYLPVYIYGIPELVVSIKISLMENCC